MPPQPPADPGAAFAAALAPVLGGLDGAALAISGLRDGLRAAAADASLFLLVGGLVMLTVICALVLLQNFLPDRETERLAESRPGLRRLRSLDGGPLAQDLARRNGRDRRPAAIAPVDLALDRVVELRIGEPRLLQAQERNSRVRPYACRGCSFAASNAPLHAHAGGCTRERAALEEVFAAVYGGTVRAQESSCRRRGDAACEFEVVH